MKNIKKFNEHISENNILNNIIDELKRRKEDFDNPGSYLDEEWYVKCESKSEAFEEAIDIVKKNFNL